MRIVAWSIIIVSYNHLLYLLVLSYGWNIAPSGHCREICKATTKVAKVSIRID